MTALRVLAAFEDCKWRTLKTQEPERWERTLWNIRQLRRWLGLD